MEHSIPAKKVRLVLLTALLTAISAPTFAQTSKAPNDETVTVPGLHTVPGSCHLELLNSMPLEINKDVLTVPADVNGETKSFLFDTAAIANQMTDASARSLGLHPSTPDTGGPRVTGNIGANPLSYAQSGYLAPGQSPPPGRLSGAPDSFVAEIYDTRGTAYTQMVTVADLIMQAMETRNVDFHVTPLPPPGVDGVIDIEMFRHFDIDLDFTNRRFNTFSQDHCKGQVIYWRTPGVAALPFLTKDNRVITHVTLDGKDLLAAIDTGSPYTILHTDIANSLGLMPDAASMVLVGDHHDDSREDLYAHTFKTLSFGSVAIGNPRLMLSRGILVRGSDPNLRTGSLIRNNDTDTVHPDIIIGMDMLKLMHVYFALGERVLYVTQGNELAEGATNALPVVPVDPERP